MRKALWNEDWKSFNHIGKDYFVPLDAKNTALPHSVDFADCCTYYKYFVLNEKQRGKKLFIQFEGVDVAATVFLNGQHILSLEDARAGFVVDITDKVVERGRNLLCVLARGEGFENTVGITKDVFLLVGDDIFITPLGLKIKTPEAYTNRAVINTETEIFNSLDKNKTIIACTTIYNPKGRKAASKRKKITIRAGKFATSLINITLKKAQLWSPLSPFVYRAVTELYENVPLEDIKSGKVLPFDTIESDFGIRTIEYVIGGGISVNGIKIKLCGANIPLENGMLSECDNFDASARKVRLLKEADFNAVRVVGIPQPSLVRACDYEGMFILPEIFDVWQCAKKANDGHLGFNQEWQTRIEGVVKRFINNPSVIMWGIGNDPVEKNSALVGAKIAEMLATHTRSIDQTRAVVLSASEVVPDFDDLDNLVSERSFINDENEPEDKIMAFSREGNYFGAKTESFFARVDVAGYINLHHRYGEDLEAFGDRLILGVDTQSKNLLDAWEECSKYPSVLGDFASNVLASYKDPDAGEIDMTGQRRPESYLRSIIWGGKHSKIAAHDPDDGGKLVEMWNFPRYLGQKVSVSVFTAGDVVALYHNGRMVGRKIAGKSNNYTATFDIEYQVGRLEAVCFLRGEEFSRAVLETSSSPKALRINSGAKKVAGLKGALVFVDIEVLDEQGRVVPFADRLITVEVRGVGKKLALGNSAELARSDDDTVSVKYGRAQAIIELDGNAGKLEVICTCTGLKKSSISMRIT